MFKKLLFFTIFSSLSLFAAQQYKNIEFEGLTQISKRVALENLKFKSENSYTQQEINKAIKDFYNFGYFRDIWVTKENGILTFNFKEKPFISNLEIKGYKTDEEQVELLYTQMNIKKGNMYTEQRVENARQSLLEILEREGLVNSVIEVTVDEINENSVSVLFEVNKGEEVVITQIDFKGTSTLEQDDFEEVIVNREAACCFTWFIGVDDGEMNYEQLEFDSARIRDLYLQNGYLDAQVSQPFSKIDFNTNTANIEYIIDEGEQYSVSEVIIYLNEEVIKLSDILPELKLKEGDVFNINQVRADKEYIRTQVANKGYAFTDVSFNLNPNKEKKDVTVIYNVTEGDKVFINDVFISGNTRTLDRVIRRDVYLAPGDLFSLTDYKDSINKLKRTGYFENVVINQKRVTSSKIDLEVVVTETSTGNLTIGGGYGSYEGWMISGSIKDKNIFGSGLEVGFSLDYSKVKTDFTVELTNPSLYDGPFSGTIKAYNQDSEYTDFDDVGGDKKVDQTGFLLGSSRAIGRHTRAGANYTLSDSDIKYSDDSSLDETYITSAIEPFIRFNNTDDFFLPREGFMLGTNYQFAGIGGDAKYGLSSSYFKFFYGLEDLIDYDIIFRYKNSLKMLFDNGFIPNDNSFYLGGPKSLRGYETYAFKPDNVRTPLKRFFSNSVELSFPLLKKAKMRWGLFYDYGMIGEENFDEIRRSGAGAFLSWNSPVGPMQFIFAEALDAESGDETASFEFNLGGKF